MKTKWIVGVTPYVALSVCKIFKLEKLSETYQTADTCFIFLALIVGL